MDRFPARRITGFFLRAAAFYALLLSSWHGLTDAYRVVFRAMGNVAMPRLANGAASARFLRYADNPHGADTSVKIVKRATGASGNIDLKSGFLGFRPTAFLVALVLATPISWPRRSVALVLGLLAVSLLVLLRTWLQLADKLSAPSPLQVYELSASWKSALTACLNILVHSPPSGYIVPGILWVMVTFRRGDWERLAHPSFPARTQQPGGDRPRSTPKPRRPGSRRHGS